MKEKSDKFSTSKLNLSCFENESNLKAAICANQKLHKRHAEKNTVPINADKMLRNVIVELSRDDLDYTSALEYAKKNIVRHTLSSTVLRCASV